LEGFVNQQTTFPFEVLVHDDASTDGTADIIREYAARYPAIIRPVFQQENQYQKGVVIAREILFPLIRGRYVALCEGDDYWTDPHKLQKQVDALEAHPGVDICAHRVQKKKDGKPVGYEGHGRRTRLYPTWRVILGGGGFVATCSLLCRREAYMADTPMRRLLFYDYTLQVQGALRGGMYYLRDCMAVYRRGVPGSWSSYHEGLHKTAHHPAFKRMLEALDTYTEGRWHRVIRLRIFRYDAHDFLRKLL
jgi:glycosyltransferase involved in cell wall biosynthesis